MAHFHNNALIGASGQGGGYNIEQSLKFRAVASNYLSRTPSSSGNRKIWTYSWWIKRSLLSNRQDFISVGTASNNTDTMAFRFNTTDTLTFAMWSSDIFETSQVFRDPSSWYHIVLNVDTTQATSSNRVKLYVNGTQITNFNSISYPSLNQEFAVNGNIEHNIGRARFSSSFYFDGYITEVNLIDGQALTPSYFGESNEDTGVWQPIKYTGTYGTNGFYLNGTNNSSTTILDQSGNGNNWTTSGMTLSSSTSVNYAIATDVPTLTDQDTGNFCVYNYLDKATMSVTNANTTAVNNAGGSWHAIRGTIGVSSGKWYWEADAVYDTYLRIGVALGTASLTSVYNNPTDSWTYVDTNGNKTGNGSETGYGASWTDGTTIGVALDMDAGTLTFYKAGVSQGVAFNSGLSGKQVFPLFAGYNTSRGFTVNFGQRPFKYTPPTGYKKLNTFNLPDSNITDGSQHFAPIIYTGNGVNDRDVTVGFAPDFTWIKRRDSAADHMLFNTIRGAGYNVFSNRNIPERYQDSGGYLSAFTSDGFQLHAGSTDASNVNGSGNTYVAWNWRGSDSTAVSNTNGTITSQVSANPTSGFSVVKYTGTNGGVATVGHGLGVAPKVILTKDLTYSNNNWFCYHSYLGNTSVLYLDLTNAVGTGRTEWNSTSPSATLFTINTNNVNRSGSNFIAYCFAEVEGFSKFGSYTGNGSADGPFVYTGFRPKFVMIKRTDTSGYYWRILDTARDTYNQASKALYPNVADAEVTSFSQQDFLSNGFKIRTSDAGTNASGGTYIFMCFAENPFKNSLAR